MRQRIPACVVPTVSGGRWQLPQAKGEPYVSKIIGFLGRSVSRTLYVRVTKDRMQVRHIESGREISLDAAQPFTSSRLLVANFSAAQRLLIRGIGEAAGRFGLASVIVIHPAEMMDGGLSESDERLFFDLGYGTGAQYVAVVTDALSDAEVRQVTRSRRLLRA